GHLHVFISIILLHKKIINLNNVTMKAIYQFNTKRKLASFLVIIFSLFVSNFVDANNSTKEEIIKEAFIQYKGKILDSSDKTPLEYANLSIEGTNVKTITN